MMFRSREIKRFENASTAVVASPIPRALVTDVVVASVGHMPSTNTNVGLLSIIPLFICVSRRLKPLFAFSILMTIPF